MSAQSVRAPTGTITYTDTGTGPPVILLHGNPTSARLYRSLIATLSPTYRCIAPDHLGFGRSEAPASACYRPPAHATRLTALLRRIDGPLTLVCHDWGGPIGLSYALRHPHRVQRLVLTNTWMWALAHRPLVYAVSRLLGTAVGRWAIEEMNAFPRLVMPLTLGPDAALIPDWIAPYAEALDTPVRRRACRTLARSLIGETDWLRALWSRRSRLRNCTTLLCWGMADPAFGTEATLQRWTTLFPDARLHRFRRVGHYVPEEMSAEFASLVRDFLDDTTP